MVIVMHASTFDEGRSAGFFGIGKNKNPYRKGIPGSNREVDTMAAEWDRGYERGDEDNWQDVIAAKRKL